MGHRPRTRHQRGHSGGACGGRGGEGSAARHIYYELTILSNTFGKKNEIYIKEMLRRLMGVTRQQNTRGGPVVTHRRR